MTSVVESHPAPTHLSVDHTDQAFHVVSRGMDGHGVCQPMETWVMLASFFFFQACWSKESQCTSQVAGMRVGLKLDH